MARSNRVRWTCSCGIACLPVMGTFPIGDSEFRSTVRRKSLETRLRKSFATLSYESLNEQPLSFLLGRHRTTTLLLALARRSILSGNSILLTIRFHFSTTKNGADERVSSRNLRLSEPVCCAVTRTCAASVGQSESRCVKEAEVSKAACLRRLRSRFSEPIPLGFPAQTPGLSRDCVSSARLFSAHHVR